MGREDEKGRETGLMRREGFIRVTDVISSDSQEGMN